MAVRGRPSLGATGDNPQVVVHSPLVDQVDSRLVVHRSCTLALVEGTRLLLVGIRGLQEVDTADLGTVAVRGRFGNRPGAEADRRYWARGSRRDYSYSFLQLDVKIFLCTHLHIQFVQQHINQSNFTLFNKQQLHKLFMDLSLLSSKLSHLSFALGDCSSALKQKNLNPYQLNILITAVQELTLTQKQQNLTHSEYDSITGPYQDDFEALDKMARKFFSIALNLEQSEASETSSDIAQYERVEHPEENLEDTSTEQQSQDQLQPSLPQQVVVNQQDFEQREAKREEFARTMQEIREKINEQRNYQKNEPLIDLSGQQQLSLNIQDQMADIMEQINQMHLPESENCTNEQLIFERESEKLNRPLQKRRFESIRHQLRDPFQESRKIWVDYIGETVNGIPQGVGQAIYTPRRSQDSDAIAFKLFGRFANGEVSENIWTVAQKSAAYVYKGKDEETCKQFVRFYNSEGNLQYFGWANSHNNSDGKGIWVNKSTGDIFNGEWVDGVMSKGTLTKIDGSEYQVTYDWLLDLENGVEFYNQKCVSKVLIRESNEE